MTPWNEIGGVANCLPNPNPPIITQESLRKVRKRKPFKRRLFSFEHVDTKSNAWWSPSFKKKSPLESKEDFLIRQETNTSPKMEDNLKPQDDLPVPLEQKLIKVKAPRKIWARITEEELQKLYSKSESPRLTTKVTSRRKGWGPPITEEELQNIRRIYPFSLKDMKYCDFCEINSEELDNAAASVAVKRKKWGPPISKEELEKIHHLHPFCELCADDNTDDDTTDDDSTPLDISNYVADS